MALTFGFSTRSIASSSRWTRDTASTASFTSSISRRLIVSVNSIARIRRDTSIRARSERTRARRYFFLSFFGTSVSFSASLV